jgi:hypothetical protein
MVQTGIVKSLICLLTIFVPGVALAGVRTSRTIIADAAGARCCPKRRVTAGPGVSLT